MNITLRSLLWTSILPILQVNVSWAHEDPNLATQQELLLDEDVEEDLDKLILEHTDSHFQPKLDLYGFADFGYYEFLMDRSSAWYNILDPYSSFLVGNFNLYLSSSLGSSLRSLGEVRFTYMPHGQYQSQDGGFSRLSTDSPDPNNSDRSVQWGGVVIERAWVEYQFLDLVSVRLGHWITPVGIWNVDHASPTIITSNMPFIIGEKLFPRSQTGLQLRGSFSFWEMSLEYILTLSNGRGPIDKYRDLDNNKALGARLNLTIDSFGHLKMGLSAYRGQFTDRSKQISFDPDNNSIKIYSPIVERFEELGLAADIRWQYKQLIIQSEWIMTERAWADSARPEVEHQNGFQRDYRAWGVYGLVAYRLPWFSVMPFVFVEYYDRGVQTGLRESLSLNMGLNFRPIPVLVLKAQHSHVWTLTHSENYLFKDPLSVFNFQVAWSF